MGIRLAKQAAVKDLQKYVDRVLEALGRKGSLVTDESIVSDFLELGGTDYRVRRGKETEWEPKTGDPIVAKRNDMRISTATGLLGIPMERSDAVVAVARRLKEFVQGGKS